MAPPAAHKREDRGRPPTTQGKRGAQIRTSERHAQSDGGDARAPATSPRVPRHRGPRRLLERWGAEGQPAGSGLAPSGWDGGRLPGTTARKRVAADGWRWRLSNSMK
jgi:hypothetical protein